MSNRIFSILTMMLSLTLIISTVETYKYPVVPDKLKCFHFEDNKYYIGNWEVYQKDDCTDFMESSNEMIFVTSMHEDISCDSYVPHKKREQKKKTLKEKYNLTLVEIEQLKQLAMAEAGNQGPYGIGLVMLCILNRIESDDFPNSFSEVIYQPYQFTPIMEGTWYNLPYNEDCEIALKMVSNGKIKTDATYFKSVYNQGTWHESNLTYLYTYKDHEFYK